MTTYFQIPNYGTSARVYERNIEQKHAGKMGRGCKDVKVGIGARGKEERTVAALAISKTNKDTINTAKKMGYVKLASYIAGPENNNLYVRPKDVARTFSDVIEKKSEKKLSDLNELISLTRKPPNATIQRAKLKKTQRKEVPVTQMINNVKSKKQYSASNHPHFHNIDQATAYNKLFDTAEGTYLLRPSSQEGYFTVSYKGKGEGEVIHERFKLDKATGEVIFDNGDRAGSIDALIQINKNYCKKPIPHPVRGHPAFYDVTTDQAQGKLIPKGEGTYLLRPSSQEGLFCISYNKKSTLYKPFGHTRIRLNEKTGDIKAPEGKFKSLSAYLEAQSKTFKTPLIEKK